MYLVNAQEMRELDRQTVERLGIPAAVLMEVAGRAVAEQVKERRPAESLVTVLAGHGNNGGDGLVAARHLADAGYKVDLWLVGRTERMGPETRRYWEACERLGLAPRIYSAADEAALRRSLEQADVVIDSMLGIGLSGSVRSPMREVIQWVNEAAVPLVIAADVPSGVHADSGAMLPEAVQADVTVTFAFPKWCHYLAPAAERTGELVVADIGIPKSLAAAYPIRARVTDETSWSAWLRPRSAFSHKGTFGHVLVIGGTRGMSGAPALASRAVLKTGAGLVTTAVPQGIQDTVAGFMAEGLTWGLGSGDAERWHGETALLLAKQMHHYDAVAIGPGMGRFTGDSKWLQTVLSSASSPLVLDADALNILSADLRILEGCQVPVVLTPHPGEMARLLQREVSDVEQDRPAAAKALVEKTGAAVILKGRFTITALPDGRQYVNTTGTPAMAKGGSGDVLTGIIAARLAMGMPVDAAVPFAVSLHGYAGELASGLHSETGVLASDIITHIGPALQRMMSNDS